MRDTDADQFEETERRLVEWAKACRERSLALNLPKVSSIFRMIEHVRTESRLRHGVREKSTRRRRQDRNSGDGDPKARALEMGHADKEPTAKGHHTRSFIEPKVSIESQILQVDYAVARLPEWARKTIKKSYLAGQSDYVAALELRKRIGEYMQQRRAAVQLVANLLTERYIRPR